MTDHIRVAVEKIATAEGDDRASIDELEKKVFGFIKGEQKKMETKIRKSAADAAEAQKAAEKATKTAEMAASSGGGKGKGGGGDGGQKGLNRYNASFFSFTTEEVRPFICLSYRFSLPPLPSFLVYCQILPINIASAGIQHSERNFQRARFCPKGKRETHEGTSISEELH